MVTDVKSDSNIEVDGIPRHVSDLRRAPDPDEEETRRTRGPNGAIVEDRGARLWPQVIRQESDPQRAAVPVDEESPASRNTNETSVEGWRARLRPQTVEPSAYRV